MSALADPLTRQWLARSLSGLAPALRELAVILGTPPAFGLPPTPDELTSAADVIERAAACLVHPVGDMAP